MEPRNIKSGGMSVAEFQKKATSKGWDAIGPQLGIDIWLKTHLFHLDIFVYHCFLLHLGKSFIYLIFCNLWGLFWWFSFFIRSTSLKHCQCSCCWLHKLITTSSFFYQIWNTSPLRCRWLGTSLLDEHRLQSSPVRCGRLRLPVRRRSERLERRTSPDHSRLCLFHPGRWRGLEDRRSQHCLPLLWHVEVHLCLAYWGHGSLQHQLPALRSTKVLVCRATKIWQEAGTSGTKWVL